MPAQLRFIGYISPWVLAALAIGYMFANPEAYEVKGGLLVLLAIGLLGLLFVNQVARAEMTRWLLVILALGLVAKLATSLFRMFLGLSYLSTSAVTGTGADFIGYHRAGVRIAERVWALDFDSLLFRLQAHGTTFVEGVAGVVHSVVGPTLMGAFLVFGLLSFIGMYFYYRAFAEGFPNGNRRLYALLVFFWPTLLFWSNGMGKDALMALFIGLTVYGTAKLFKGNFIAGVLLIALGLFLSMHVRIHVAGILALTIAMAFGLSLKGASRSLPTYILGVVAVAAVAFFLVPKGAQKAGLEEFSVQAVQDLLEDQQGNLYQGGSRFKPPSITEPFGVPMIVATILFRPFPWEAHNRQALMQSLDGILMIGLVSWRIRHIAQAIRHAPGSPFLLFVLIYTLIFMYIFISISNFGLLARQRGMLFPILFMLVAYEPPPKQEATQIA